MNLEREAHQTDEREFNIENMPVTQNFGLGRFAWILNGIKPLTVYVLTV